MISCSRACVIACLRNCVFGPILTFCYYLLRYYIPNPDDQGLVFTRNKEQNSVKSLRTGQKSQGTYCTAWFNHGTNPSGSKNGYEYAVQVEAEPSGGVEKQPIPSNFYSVIKKDTDAHVVRFLSTNGRGTVHGYVVFPVAPADPINLSGPLTSVHNQSIIMVEEKASPDRLYISVTSPQLNLTKTSGSPSWCEGGNTAPSKSEDVDETLLYCAKSKVQVVHVSLRETWSTLKSLHVGGKNKMGDQNLYLVQGSPATRNLKFINLRNGADTEISYDREQEAVVEDKQYVEN